MDDTMQDLENKAGRSLQTTSSMIFAVNSIRHMFAESKNASERKKAYQRKKAMSKWRIDMCKKCFGANPFSFTGNVTDLCYFYACEKMPKTLISEIPDKNLRNAVIKTFESLQNQSMIETVGDDFVLTNAGINCISGKGFLENAKKSQENVRNVTEETELSSAEEHRTTYELNGTERDLGIFNLKDDVNLEDMAFEMNNLDLEDKIQINFKAWEEKGIVETGDDINYTLTEKGKEFLNSEIYNKKFNVEKATAKEVSPVGIVNDNVTGKSMTEKVTVSNSVVGKGINVAKNINDLAKAGTMILEKMT